MARTKIVMLLLAVVTGFAGGAFGDAQTVDFDAYMSAAAVWEYQGGTPYNFLAPATADNNGNGILDATEFAVLSAIFADTNAPNHQTIHEAWKNNFDDPVSGNADTKKDMGSIALSLLAGIGGSGQYGIHKIMAAYVTIGDGDFNWAPNPYFNGSKPASATNIPNIPYGFKGSWGIYGETIWEMVGYGSLAYQGAPADANYDRLPDLVSACLGDADGDGVNNIGEYNGQGGDRAAYVAAALNPAITTAGGDIEGVCEEGPGDEGYVWGETLFYRQETGSVYYLWKSEVSWYAGQALARNFTIGEKAVFTGNLASIETAEENTWVHENIRSSYTEDMNCWLGGNDIATEGKWVWVDGERQFWQGQSSGSTVGGLYANGNSGAPNASGDGCQMYASGKWDDTPESRAKYCIIEFDNGGAGYPDENSNGEPDAWEGLVGPGNPTLPNVVGMTEAAATAALEALELTVNVEEEYSETVAAGLVISQDPAAGTALEGLTEVTIVVSPGPAPEDFAKQPRGGWFEVGDTLTLEVELSLPVPPVEYQWQKNQEDIPGEEANTLVFDPLALGDTGHYRCVVHDGSAKGEFISAEVYVLVVESLPVAAGAGLAVLSGACALAGAFVVRRKK